MQRAPLTGISPSGWSGVSTAGKQRVNADNEMEHKQNRQNKHNKKAQLNAVIIVNKVMAGMTAGAETLVSSQEGGEVTDQKGC